MRIEDPPASPEDREEEPAAPVAPVTEVGLPRRVRQANLSPLLRAGPIGRPADDGDIPPIEALHAVRDALLRDEFPVPGADENAAGRDDPAPGA